MTRHPGFLDVLLAFVMVAVIGFIFGFVAGRADAATPRGAVHVGAERLAVAPFEGRRFATEHDRRPGAPQTDEALARVEHRVADNLRTEAGKAGGSNAARTADRLFQSGWEASGHGAPTFAVSSTGAPQSGAGDAAASSYWLRPTARDPSNGGESPRHPSALRGAETAEGGAPFPPGGSARPASPAARPSEVRDLDAPEPSASAVSVRGNPGTTAPPPETWTRQGIASTYGPGWDGWTASPWPIGTTLDICGPGGCETRTTNDYGPDQRIFPDRVVDLDVLTFEAVCAVPWRRGLCPVTVTVERLP